MRENGSWLGERRFKRPPTAFTPFRSPRTFWTRTSQWPGRTRSGVDISDVATGEGWRDLAVVIDLFARRVVAG